MTENAKTGERIARRMARAGLCSRREAESWIEAGRVAVNGAVITSAALNVTDADIILVDGKKLPEAEEVRLFRFHKPAGLVTTSRDEKGRETVFDRLPPGMPRVISVGRLDLNSEGLLLLTNDGDLARKLELPSNGWERRYRVRAFGTPDADLLAGLANGTEVDGVRYGPITATIDKAEGRNAWLTVTLAEGKKREVRRVLESIGLKVNRLIRMAYGPFELGRLPAGAVDEVPPRVIAQMMGEKPKKGEGWARAAKPQGRKPPYRPRRPQDEDHAGKKTAGAGKRPARRPSRPGAPAEPRNKKGRTK